MLTEAEVAVRVRAEAVSLFDKIIRVTEVDGFRNGDSVSHWSLDPPVRARILSDESSLVRWVDDRWCDPVYEIELLEDRPELTDLTSPWVYGTSYSLDGGTEPARFEIER